MQSWRLNQDFWPLYIAWPQDLELGRGANSIKILNPYMTVKKKVLNSPIMTLRKIVLIL
jgi:hypothetical protein